MLQEAADESNPKERGKPICKKKTEVKFRKQQYGIMKLKQATRAEAIAAKASAKSKPEREKG